MTYHRIHISILCVLHELLLECVSFNPLLEKMICHKIHSCNLYALDELYECISSNILLGKMISLRIHLCGLHELCGCDSFKMLLHWRMIFYKNHTYLWMCFLNYYTFLKFFSHKSHLRSLLPSWQLCVFSMGFFNVFPQ